ncbi:MAG: TrkH family potassium uptake protein [Candidatus Egerieousia sp.]
MNVGLISRNVGVALVFNAAFMLSGAFVAVLNGWDTSFFPLFYSAIITLATGLFPLIFVRRGGVINLREGYFSIVLSWILSCIFGMLPYVIWGGEFSAINAWYESVSGYTTTGSTILNDVEALPKGLLFWRTATHYIGGLGVVVFMILVLPTSRNAVGLKISKLEISELSKANYRFRLSKTARIIITVYLVITISQTVLMRIAGMSLFDSLNHAMAIVSTGGFSTKNMSAAAFDSPVVEVIMIVFMFLSSLHFGLLYSSAKGHSFRVFRNPVIKFYSIVLLAVIIFSAGNLLLSGNETNVFTALRHSAFMNISTASSTGLAVDETGHWPVTSLLMLLFLSLMGACSGSTTGGIKADRVCLWFSSLRARLKKQVNYNAVVRTKLGNRVIDSELIADVNVFIIFYLLIVFVCAILLAITGLSLQDAVAASVACMGNIGLTFGSGGAFASYSDLPVLSKFICTVEMFIGRLEIYPFITFFALRRWK